jgi:hypothetical protein
MKKQKANIDEFINELTGEDNPTTPTETQADETPTENEPAQEETPQPIEEPTQEPTPEPIEEPAPEKKKETRGRKKKNLTDIKSELDNGQPAPATNQVIEEAKKDVSHLVNGYILLMVLDFIAPMVLVFIFSFFNKNAAKVDKSNLQMTNAEAKKLEPLADEVAKQVLSGLNPLVLFGICYFGTMGMKLQIELIRVQNKN